MATTAEINAGFQYQGNAALGGGNNGVIAVDTKPLDNLAFYTMQYHKLKWEENNKETNARVAELADVSDIRLNDLLGKDKEQATTEYADLIKQYQGFAKRQPKNAQEKVQLQLDIQTAKQKFMDNYSSGKQRAISYEKQKNDINGNVELNAAQKDIAIKDLDKRFADTNIATPISAGKAFKYEKINLPAPALSEAQAVDIGSNTDFNTDISYLNPKVVSSQAAAIEMGLHKAYIPKTIKDSTGAEIPNPEYSSLSQTDQMQQEGQAATVSQAKIWADSAEILNSVLLKKGADDKPLYINEDGTFNNKKFEDDNFANSTLMTPYFALVKYGKYSDDLQNQLADPDGAFVDNNVKYKLRTPIDPNDARYGHIDLSKGVTANQVISAGIAAQHTGNTFKSKEINTDNKIQADAQAKDLEKTKLTIAGENYRANLPYNKLKEADKLKAEEQQKLADDFGNIIYNVNVDKPINLKQPDGTVLQDVKVKQGTLLDKDDNKIEFNGYVRLPTGYFDNSIVTEYDKYVGGIKLDKDGNPLTTSTPTKLLRDADGNFVVKMKNGEIDGIKADDGSFVSVDQFRHITLTAGQKGTTKYKKPDTQLGNTGKGSGKNSQKVDEYGVPIP